MKIICSSSYNYSWGSNETKIYKLIKIWKLPKIGANLLVFLDTSGRKNIACTLCLDPSFEYSFICEDWGSGPWDNRSSGIFPVAPELVTKVQFLGQKGAEYPHYSQGHL